MSDRKSNIPAPRASRPSNRTLRVRTAAHAPSPEQRASATRIALSEDDAASVSAVMAKLPDPATLPPGALVIIPAEVARAGRSLARSVLAVFGHTKTITRARRCSALVARGYVGVGAAEDETRADVAWGYASSDGQKPSRPPASEEA